MTRRRWVLLLVPVTVLLALAAAVWLVARPTPITSTNADRVQVGMTLAEVEAILGGPARDETTGPVEPDGGWDHWFRFAGMNHAPTHDPECPVWKSDQAFVQIRLDDEHRVLAKDHVHVHRTDEGVREMLRRWLGV